MSKNRQNQTTTTTTAPIVEDEKSLLALQAANAQAAGFTVELNDQGEPMKASKGESNWQAQEGGEAFVDWVKSVMDATEADKVVATSQGPQGEESEGSEFGDANDGPEGPVDEKKGPVDSPVVGELPANPNGEGTGGGLKDEARPGLIAEVGDDNEVLNVKRAEPSVDLAADGVQLSAFQTRMAWIAEHGTTHEQYVKNVMTNYVQVCTTSVDLEKIAVEQKRFWRLFAYLHAHPAEFNKLFNIVIEFARQYQDELFNLQMLYRAQEGLSMGADEMQCYNNLRTLVLNTIQSKSKKAVKSILDIRKIVDHPLIPEIVRGQYVAFYQ